MPVKKEYAHVHPLTREEWRAWLEAHHASEPGVWLVSFKTVTGKPRVSWDDAVDEAICFGWIDSVQRTIDDERLMQLITPRKPGSPWSAVNKRRIERLQAEGRLAPAGITRIEAAKRDGSWTAADAVEALTVPPDLAAALARRPEAEVQLRRLLSLRPKTTPLVDPQRQTARDPHPPDRYGRHRCRPENQPAGAEEHPVRRLCPERKRHRPI